MLNLERTTIMTMKFQGHNVKDFNGIWILRSFILIQLVPYEIVHISIINTEVINNESNKEKFLNILIGLTLEYVFL